MVGVRFSLDDQWVVVPLAASRSWAAYRDGTDLETAERTIHASIELLDKDVPVVEYARRIMERHVRQGLPVESSCVLSGLPALEYQWTDGVAWVVTWFIERKPNHVSRIELAQSIRYRPIPDSNDDDWSAVRSLSWLPIAEAPVTR